MSRPAVRLLLSLVIALTLLGALMLLGGVSLGEVFAALGRLSPGVLLLAVAMHAGTYLIRALRFQLLLPAGLRPGYGSQLAVGAAHNLASYLLPAKTGEAAFVLYLRMQCGVPGSAGLAALALARVLDGAVLLGCFAVACLVLFQRHPDVSPEWLLTPALVASSAALVLFLVSRRSDVPVRLAAWGSRFLIGRWRLGRALLARLDVLARALASAGDGPRLYAALGLTVAMWLNIFGFFTLLALHMGLPEFVHAAEVTFSAALGSLANLLPLNGAAGVGTQELGFVTGMHQVLGVDYELALSAGFGLHVVQLVDIVVFGLVGHLFLGVLPRLDVDEGAVGAVEPPARGS